eukprot:CAMPEP_0171266908 /NCGR_PEP_ID=MMETSP0790-20130122/58887_1 /TAXON_ID=2925 /ORGANISM="Alexandrium catenella, Strain OF101" /LENGTH=46 /DNA_ID= /DNA_START= /DNA_END= /DNA_ORIENTATION=
MRSRTLPNGLAPILAAPAAGKPQAATATSSKVVDRESCIVRRGERR